ncbi:MAG: DUF5011 domain-containing protein, partial [Bacteroidia bacterium]|nr:DUF5011 domain-containing protein [Bacteroidia bacterium]
LEVMRPTTITPMERKAWIDFNLDADFIDQGEQIMNENNGLNSVGVANFMIPNDIAPGRVTRLRIGTSEGGTTLTPDKARAGCFEDYAIEVGLDLVAPDISIKGDAVYRVQRGQIYVDPGVVAIDNREGDISSRYETTNNINMSSVGVYKARYWVKDLYGNVSDTVERTIQVEVNQVGPKVTLIGPDTITLEARTDSYTELGAIAIDNVGDTISDRIIRLGRVDTAYVGTYYVNYSVRDAFGFTGEKTRVVRVRKTNPPTVTPAAGVGKIVKHQINTPYTLALGLSILDYKNYFSLDQLTITQTGAPNVAVPGSYFIQVTVCDPLGNCSAPTQIQIDVQDTIAPVLGLKGANPLIVDVYNSNYEDPGVTATDNYNSENSLIHITENGVNTNQLGTYKIKYTVRDGSGNSTEITRDVKVVDRIAPVIEMLGGDPFELIWNDTFEMANEIRITDNYNLGEDLMQMVQKTTTLSVDLSTGKYYGGERGWKDITYQVTDSSGNTSNKARRRVYVDFKTGLKESTSNQMLAVYPNPSNGVFTINTKENLTGKTEVVMYNILGAKVYNQTIEMVGNTATLNVQGLSAGVYMLQITNNGKQYTQRISMK